MSFDNSARRYDFSGTLNSSRLLGGIKSPEAILLNQKEFNGSILRNKFENTSSSARLRSSRGQSSVTKKVSYADFTSPTLDSHKTDSDLVDKKERKTTPKKYHFFSDYLKDFEPGVTDFKTPVATDFKSNFLEKPSASGAPFESSGHVKTMSFMNQDNFLNIDTKDLGLRVLQTANGAEISSRKENKKEEIKQRLSQLSEKLYSPEKSRPFVEVDKPDVPNFRGNMTGRRNQDLLLQENNESTMNRSGSDFKTHPRLSMQNLDVKYRIMTQEYENTISSLKFQLDKVERTNAEMVMKLREDLKEAREDLLREKSEGITRTSTDIKLLNAKIRELQENLKQEREKTRQLEETLEENKAEAERKLSDMAKEVERMKSEKERKVEEANNLIKSQNQTQQEIIAKIRAENDVIVRKLKDEQSVTIRDLKSQLERKKAELERVQQDRADAINSLNVKANNLQEITKNNQDTYSKLNRMVELKDAEIDKLTRKLNDTKKECSSQSEQIHAMDHEKRKLEEENERLKVKTLRLEKMIYGKGKIPSQSSGYPS